MAEFYDMLEAAAGRAERALDVEEGLLRLRPEIARRADDLVVDVAALLAGDVEDTPRPDRLDRVIEARILKLVGGLRKREFPGAPPGAPCASASAVTPPRAATTAAPVTRRRRDGSSLVSAIACGPELGCPRHSEYPFSVIPKYCLKHPVRTILLALFVQI